MKLLQHIFYEKTVPDPVISGYTPPGASNPITGRRNEPLEIQNNFVYRGDSRSPQEIMNTGGFNAKGNNSNLKDHVLTNNQESNFISTSKDISVAQRFAAGNSVKNQDKKSYIYEIDKNGLGFVDVNKAFSSNPYRSEQEVSVKTKIPISNITRYSVYNSKTKTSTPWLPFNQNKK